MKAYSFPKTTPFDAVTGELRPEYRDLYLKGQLSPVPAQQVEAYVSGNAVQTGVLLGRYHELVAQAHQKGAFLPPPPAWVQQQLLHQPSVSRIGPLRRPVVRLALVLFAALVLASGLQWLRNQPLLPAPVVTAMTRAAASATQATQRLVQRFNAPPTPPPAPIRPVARRTVPGRATVAASAAIEALPPRPAALPTWSRSDSLAAPTPSLLPRALANSPAATTVLISGRVSDEQGRPLPGATVLVPGSPLATSTNAMGEYALEIPTDATLQFGYGGCTDQMLSNPGTGVLNVTLRVALPTGKRRFKR